jgi:very-short-patch-repair endonuclease
VPTNGRVDFAYPKHNLVIEGDSRRWHTLLNSFEIDRLRDNAAQLAGWRVLRFTWQEITENPERVVSTIRLALLS